MVRQTRINHFMQSEIVPIIMCKKARNKEMPTTFNITIAKITHQSHIEFFFFFSRLSFKGFSTANPFHVHAIHDQSNNFLSKIPVFFSNCTVQFNCDMININSSSCVCGYRFEINGFRLYFYHISNSHLTYLHKV